MITTTNVARSLADLRQDGWAMVGAKPKPEGGPMVWEYTMDDASAFHRALELGAIIATQQSDGMGGWVLFAKLPVGRKRAA